MNYKPDWADNWVEEEFMYGTERGFMAQVGPLKNAVRMPKDQIVRPAKYSETDYVKVIISELDENGEEFPVETFKKKVLRKAKFREMPLQEARTLAEESLRNWFIEKYQESKLFVEAAEKNGLR